MIARHEGDLRRTARRYSLCRDDADDAYQRALEILLTKAPTDDLRELIRWTQTVVKHEALGIRRNRERLHGGAAPTDREGNGLDWVALIPSSGDGPPERAERREAIARSREALQALKPQELRALTLLAEGYSYKEIGSICGWTQTKVNRCLAEGRERFRRLLTSSEDGSRCAELRPLLSSFCDGEATATEAATLREHLRACGPCRSTMRAYRGAPRAVAALAPVLPASRSLLERAHEAFASLHSRLPNQGGTTDSVVSQVAAAGGTRGAGMAVLAKVLAVCVGTAGGAAACVATGVAPAPLGIASHQTEKPVLERPAKRVVEALSNEDSPAGYQPAPAPEPPPPEPEPAPAPPPPSPSTPESSSTGAVEFTPEAAAAAPSPPSGSAGSTSGSAAGEFGP